MDYKRLACTSIAGLALLASLAGCTSETEPDKQAAAPPSATSATQVSAPTNAPSSDIQSLQQGRKQDAQVIQDAQKAVGALHP